MATTVAAGSSATFELGPFDTITLTDANAIGKLTLTSQAPKLVSDQVLAVQNGTFGPWLAPMSVVMSVTQGSADYTVNVKSLTATQAASTQSILSGNPAQPVVTGLDTAYSRAQIAHWPCNDGSGTSLAEAIGKGPPITVAGTVTSAWGTASWFTHDATGNTLQLKNLPYIDGLIDMTTNGAILIGCDYYVTTWPTSGSEYLWGLHRVGESTTGGLGLSIASGSPGRFSVQYKSNGGSLNEVVGFAPSTYLSTRNSLLVEAIVNTTRGELTIHFFHNGRLERSNVWTLGTPPAASSACGLNFSGYGATPTAKLGTATGTAGTRVQNLFVARHSGSDRNIAGRLARDIYANAALPSWLVRV